MTDKKNKAFMMTEMLVGLGILAILLSVMAVSLDRFRRFNHYQLAKQRCTSAALAQLDSITVMGRSIKDVDFKKLWPEMKVSVEKSDGRGQWQGLKLIKVKTNTKSLNKTVNVELSRYILEPKGQ